MSYADSRDDPHGDVDAHEFGTFGDNPGQYDALRIIYRKPDDDRYLNTDTVADPLTHVHQHNHAGIVHGHEHTHSERNINHHSSDDHDEAGAETAGDGTG